MKTSALVLCSALAFAATASAKVTEKFSQTYPLEATGSITLENINGTVEIQAWDKAEVSLEAEKSARDQEGLDRMHLKIESSPRRLFIKTEQEKRIKFWDNMNAQVRYKLMVPAGVSLEKISVVNAGIHVVGVTGPVTLESVNGNVEAEGLSGRGKFETVNGSIKVTYASVAAKPDISLDTVNGGGTVRLPSDAAFRLDAETVNGGTSCEFPITLEKSGKRHLSGTVNGGGLAVKMASVNGGLSVKRAN